MKISNILYILSQYPLVKSECVCEQPIIISKKNPSTFVCLCNICFNCVNCLCLVESDCKVLMVLDYFGAISNCADSWFPCTCLHESLCISVFLRTGLQLLSLIWYPMLVFESSRISRAIIIGIWVTSHLEVFDLSHLLWVTFAVSFPTKC